MRQANNDTLQRQWEMLRVIPRYPIKITAKQLYEKLRNENYSVTKRTVERDLQYLSGIFSIVSDEQEKPYGWSWTKDAPVFDLPGLSNSEALAFSLVEQYLRPILPSSTLDQLNPFFKTAAKKLSSLSENSPTSSWLDKIRVIHPSQPLIAPVINSEVQRVVSEALLLNKQIRATYKKTGIEKLAEYVIHPLGLVERGQIIYLVCTLFNYDDRVTLALHRFKSAEPLNESSHRPEDFDLDAYIESGEFGFGGKESIQLQAIFNNNAGKHLLETPLSKDQVINIINDESIKVTATVIKTEQLYWWLLGFGDQVEVVAPNELRKSMQEISQAMLNMYKNI